MTVFDVTLLAGRVCVCGEYMMTRVDWRNFDNDAVDRTMNMPHLQTVLRRLHDLGAVVVSWRCSYCGADRPFTDWEPRLEVRSR